MWTTEFGGTDVDFFWKGIEAQNGHLLLAGETWSNDGQVNGNHGELDGWLVKLTGNGQRISASIENISGSELKISPNPIANSTSISFSLNQSENISLNIFDINGRLVETLADKIFEAGEHQTLFNAENFNSGIYFLKMQAGEFSRTEKLIIVK